LRRSSVLFLSLLWFFLPAFGLAGVLELEIEVSSDASINLTQFIGDATVKPNKLLIWLPSERGIAKPTFPLAESLSNSGIHVWLVDLHSSYVIPASRKSIDAFPVKDLLRLFEQAKLQGYQEIYLLSASRGARLVLDVIYEFSIANPESNLLKGSLLMHPNLFAGVPVMGQRAEFLPVASTSHLPVYLIQAEFSTKYVYTRDIREQLEIGGSRVFTHLLKNVEAGFYARDENELDRESLSARQKLPKLVVGAMDLLAQLPVKQLAPGKRKNKSNMKPVQSVTSLSPYRGDDTPPELSLIDLDGNFKDLNAYHGKVVLLNFWASWCGPCVKEIPSLQRLKSKLARKPFEIVTVNIGESRTRVVDFLHSVDADLPVLLDRNGKAAREWRIYAFPSNFLIDQQGSIRYANHGALEWDSSEVVNIVNSLF